MKFWVLFAILSLPNVSQAFTLSGDFKNGWKGPTLYFNFNLSNCPADTIAAFQDAAKLWNSVSTSFLYIKIGSIASTTTPADIMGSSATDSPVLTCDNSFESTTSFDEDAVAGVGVAAVASGTHLNYGGMILNTSSGSASVNSMSKRKLSIIIAHELGHVLGFGHSADEAALMYYNGSYKQDLRLGHDDWDAMTYLYSRDELSENDLLGCGALQRPPSGPTAALFLLLMPALLLFQLRREHGV